MEEKNIKVRREEKPTEVWLGRHLLNTQPISLFPLQYVGTD